MADQKLPNTNTQVSLFKSTAIWVALILVVLNATLLVWKPLAAVDPESLPCAHTWVWWATKEYTELTQAPDVVLLGSSMVMHAISRLDADHLNHEIDLVRHHRSNYLESALQKKGLKGDVCYNFSLPGGMMSDNYLIMRSLMTAERKPRVVVLGISMRDFMDNGVRCAGATPAFKFFSRFTPIDDIVDVSLPRAWDRLDFYSKKSLYLWGKKLDLQVVLSELTKATLSPPFAKYFGKSQLAEADPSKNLPMNVRSEVEWFPVAAHQPAEWTDNRAEYKRRYRTAHENLLATEFDFLQKSSEFADRNKIELLVVNMPLTPENHELMPPGSYETYRSRLAQFCTQHGVSLVDLDGAPGFVRSDYYDTAHMNGTGGKKLADIIVNALNSNPELATALKNPSKAKVQLATTKKI